MMSYGLRRAVDPFHEDPLPRAFYHPSSQRDVDGKDRKNHLSPERVKYQTEKSMALTPEEEAFLRGSYKYQKSYKPPSTTKEHTEIGQEEDGSSRFDESWPGSERPSSPSGCYSAHADADDFNSPVLDEIKKLSQSRGSISTLFSSRGESSSPSSMLDKVKGQLNFDDFLQPEKDEISETAAEARTTKQSSTLSKYIERFRKGVPKSREERQREGVASKKDFWWLETSHSPSTLPSSSTPKQDEDPVSGKTKTRSRIMKTTDPGDRYKSSTLTRRNLESSGLTEPMHHNPWSSDEHTCQLQEKADQLLEKTESSLNSADPAVSTDGLGQSSSDTTSIVSEVPYLPSYLHRKPHERPNASVRPARKEDDILYQWRLKRKMELAKERVYSGYVKPSVQGEYSSMKNIVTDTRPADSNSVSDDLINSKLAEFRQRLAGGGTVPVSCNFTPAPTKHSENMTTHVQPGQVPVASPFISGSLGNVSQLRGECSTHPHLHLACDILPHQDCHPVLTSGAGVTQRLDNVNIMETPGTNNNHPDVGSSCMHPQLVVNSFESCSTCGTGQRNETHKLRDGEVSQHFKQYDKIVQVNNKDIVCQNCLRQQQHSGTHQPIGTVSGHIGQPTVCQSMDPSVQAKPHPSGRTACDHSAESTLQQEQLDKVTQPTGMVSEFKKPTAVSKKESRFKYVERVTPEKDPGVDVQLTSKSNECASSGNQNLDNKNDDDSDSKCSLTDISDLGDGQEDRTNGFAAEGSSKDNRNGAPLQDGMNKCKQFGDASKQTDNIKSSRSSNRHRSVKQPKQCTDRPREARRKHCEFKDPKQHIPEPRDHSSPCRPLSCAIGQVVRDHLLSSFSADSDTSLRSSVNTLPQATLAADVPVQVPVVNVHRSKENGQITHFKIGSEMIPLSDGEEFADDELLQTLREKRQHFFQKLAELDNH